MKKISRLSPAIKMILSIFTGVLIAIAIIYAITLIVTK